MRPSGRPPAPFAVAAAARPPPGASHRKAAAAARSRAALALVLLVSAAAFFFVVNAARGGSGGIDADATPFSSSASSRPSVRTSMGTRSVSASGGAEGTSDTKAAENTAATEGAGDGASSSKKSSAPPPTLDPVSVFFARPVRELRHDGSAFTQGLEFDRICSGPYALPPDSAKGGGGCRDVFWESTGELQKKLFSFRFPTTSPSFFSPLVPLSSALPSYPFHSISQASTAGPRSGSSISSRESL